MKRFGILKPLMAAIALVAAPSLAPAALVFSDSFTEPNGPLAGTTPDLSGGNWTATTAAATPLQIASNAVQFGASGQDEYAAFTSPKATALGSVTTTLDINVASATATGDYFSHLSNPLGTASFFFQRLFARSSGSGFQLGMLDTSGGTTTWGTTVLSFGQTHRVGVTWNFVPGPVNDTFAVTVGGPSYLNHSWTSATAEPTALAAVNLRQGGSSTSAILTVDNLAVDAIPEPATAGLLGLACLGLTAARRRR